MKKIKKSKLKSKKKKTSSQEFKEVNKKAPKVKRKVIDPNSLIPSGSTILNLTCTDRIEGAFQLGKFTNIIGDSEAGKTYLVLTTLAECANLSRFDKHRLIYRDNENAGEFDIPYLFGKKAGKRIENDEDTVPETVEQMSDEVHKLLSEGVPFIYVSDSLDSLTSDAEVAGEEENRKKREKGNKADGSYGMDKQKFMSKFFRTTKKKLKKANSAVIIVSQTRDNIGFGSQFNPKTRAGGKALKFYCTHELWISVKGQKKDPKTKKRRISTDVMAKLTKNKVTGKKGEAYYTNIQEYGIDDIGSCIDFLCAEGNWSCSSQAHPTPPTSAINCKGWMKIKEKISFKKLIDKIEKEKLQQELKEEVQTAYNELLASLAPDRIRRYE